MKPVSEQFIAQAFGFGEKPVEMFKGSVEDKARQLGTTQEHMLESNLWLPFAAKEYCLSTDIKDYVLVPVPVMFTEIPNTNGDSVTLKEFLRFDTEMGMQAFKTFRGKGCYEEHANKDVTKAKGVILDVYLRPLKRFGNGKYFKLVELMAYDRTKDPLLVNSILKGENNAYSVGFYFKAYTCAVCGTRVEQGGNPCNHTFPRRPTSRQPDGKLVYRQCHNITGFETSVVGNPSYVTAIGPHLMDARGV
jgi:hypothetical protein